MGSPKKVLSIQEVQIRSRWLRWAQKRSYFLFAHTIGLNGFLAMVVMTLAHDREVDCWSYLTSFHSFRNFLVIAFVFPLVLTLVLPHRPSAEGRIKYQSFVRRYHPVMWLTYWLFRLLVSLVRWAQFKPIALPSTKSHNRPEIVVFIDPDDDQPAA